MPGSLTEITELSTALGMLAPSLAVGLQHRPGRVQHVDDCVATTERGNDLSMLMRSVNISNPSHQRSTTAQRSFTPPMAFVETGERNAAIRS